MVWELPDSEWAMLIVVSSESEMGLSTQVELRIRDQSQILVEQTSSLNLANVCLYGQVVGHWGERFWVTVATDDGIVFDIPPFTFNLESQL
jgi:hypothetical protein